MGLVTLVSELGDIASDLFHLGGAEQSAPDSKHEYRRQLTVEENYNPALGCAVSTDNFNPALGQQPPPAPAGAGNYNPAMGQQARRLTPEEIQFIAGDLNKAMAGFGRDVDVIFELLRGFNRSDASAIEAAYKAQTGRMLRDDLASELSSNDLFLAEQFLRGTPTTPRERLKRFEERLEFERSGFLQRTIAYFSTTDNEIEADIRKMRRILAGSQGELAGEDLQAFNRLMEDAGSKLTSFVMDNGMATFIKVGVGFAPTLGGLGLGFASIAIMPPLWVPCGIILAGVVGTLLLSSQYHKEEAAFKQRDMELAPA